MKIKIIVISILLLICIYKCAINKKLALDLLKDEHPKNQFKLWHLLYNKPYSLNSLEAIKRYKIFKSNLDHVNSENNKNHTYKLSISGPFADLTREEFEIKYLVKDLNEIIDKNKNLEKKRSYSKFDYQDEYVEVDKKNVKSSKDWSYLFSEARSQEGCGGCWAFATVVLLEGIITKKYVIQSERISPQELLDCDLNNYGCRGGWFKMAYQYIAQNGINYEKEYPYEGFSSGLCRAKYVICDKPAERVKITQNKNCSYCEEEEIDEFLSNGPYGAAMYVDPDFRLYDSGIYDAECTYRSNHSVIIVEKNNEYLKLLNSWGKDWGENGFGRYKYNPDKKYNCWMLFYANQPVVN